MVFLLVMAGFHVGSLITMRLFFWEHFILYLFLFDMSWWLGPQRVAGARPVVLFDGVCGLCNRFVDWLIRHDDTGVLSFAPLQGPHGEKLVPAGDSDDRLDSVVLMDYGKTYRRSSAALRAIALLGWPWNLVKLFLIVPRPIRDAVYRFVAANRYRWFGKREACRVLSAAERSRFLQ